MKIRPQPAVRDGSHVITVVRYIERLVTETS